MRQFISFFSIIFLVSFASYSFYSEFAEDKNPIQIQLIDAEKPANTYNFYWNQTDGLNKTVPQGQYEAELHTENKTFYSRFVISKAATHIPVSETSAILPNEEDAGLQLNAETFALGDTVCISFHIRQSQHVELLIQRAIE